VKAKNAWGESQERSGRKPRTLGEKAKNADLKLNCLTMVRGNVNEKSWWNKKKNY
jgi:hypothetical protein